ncbi:MAG: hypothetical protein ACKO0V_05500 [bacterium]
MKPVSIATLLTMVWAGLATGADFSLSTFDPPPKTLNGFFEIQPGTMVSNQFTLFETAADKWYTIDKVTLLFDPTTPTTAFDKLSVSIYNEVIVGGTEQPGTSQVNYDKKVSVGSLITLGNKEFRPVTFSDGTGYKFYATNDSRNYWLVVGNNNPSLKVGWAKTSSTDPIFNPEKTGAANPDTLNFSTGIGWQKPTGGDGNQIMLFAISAPEPSTYVLGTLVAGVLAFTARNPRFRKLHQRNAIAQAD